MTAGRVAAAFGSTYPGATQTAKSGTAIATTATATLARAATAGNLLVAAVHARTPWANVVIPAGWAEAVHQDRGTTLDTSIVWKTAAGGETAIAVGTNGQTITITGAPTGGTFTLSDGVHTTAAIARNATATTVSNALVAASITGWTVAGGPGPATPWTLTRSAQGALVPLLTAVGSFTGGSSPAIAVTATTFAQAVNLFEVGRIATPMLDATAGTDGGAATITSLHLASITAAAGAFVLACASFGGSPASTPAWNEGYTGIPGTSTSDRLSCAILTTPAGGATDPTATWTTAQLAAACIASFKPA